VVKEARSLIKLMVASSCVFGGLAVQPLLAEEGMQWGTVLATALANVAAGNTANAIDDLIESRGKENDHLMRVVGKAIAEIITSEAENKQHSPLIHRRLQKIAHQANHHWVDQIVPEGFKSIKKNNPELIEKIISGEDNPTETENLTLEEWKDIFVRLNMAACPGGGFPLPPEVSSQVAEKLQLNFPEVLRKTLPNDSKASASITLQLVIKIKAKVAEIKKHQTEDCTKLLEGLERLEIKLRESGDQISKKIDYSTDQVCDRIEDLEKSFNNKIEDLEKSFNNKIDFIIQQITSESSVNSLIQQTTSESSVRKSTELNWSQETKNVFFQLLLQLDFENQINSAQKIVNRHQIASFLVYGEAKHGQQLLVNRLYRLIPDWNNSQLISIDVSPNGIGAKPVILWKSIAEYLNQSRQSDPESIQEAICEKLQTQNVIFMFSSVEDMLLKKRNILREWMEEFWTPLVAKAQQQSTQKQTYLLMFLIDHRSEVLLSDLPVAETEDQLPNRPFVLPNAEPFPREVLREWITNASSFSEFSSIAGLTAETLFDKSEKGLPRYVFKEICNYYHPDLEGELIKWLI
jgi:hypothetical protein